MNFEFVTEAGSGNLTRVRELLEQNICTGTAFIIGTQMAAASCHLDIVKLLLSSGVDVNAGAFLTCAVESGRLDLIEYLLEQGADVFRAYTYPPVDPQIEKLFLKYVPVNPRRIRGVVG
jgi:hypothetical protein